MKKVFALFAIVGLLSTASCGNKEVSDETEEVEVVIEETPVQEEVIEDTTEVVVDSVATEVEG